MSLGNGTLFIILLIPFLIFSYLLLTNKDTIERVFSPEVLNRIKVKDQYLSSRARKMLFLGSIFFMILAMSHPYLKRGERTIEIAGLKILTAIDISGSMRVKDVYPNRFEFAKAKLKYLLKQMPNDEVMLIAFNNDVYLISPFTDDKDILSTVIEGISLNRVQGASDFKALAQSAKEILQNSTQKIMLIVSDGGDDNQNLKEFEKIIKENGITLYAILVGTKEGGILYDKNGKPIIINDTIKKSKLNNYLGEIAKKSGGDFVIAKYNNQLLDKLIDEIYTKFNAKDSGKRVKIYDRVELFIYPLIISVILLLSAFISIPKMDKFKKDIE